MHALTAPLSELAEIEEIYGRAGAGTGNAAPFRVCDITENPI